MKWIILLILLVGCTATATNTNLAQCLSDKGAKMYGTEWCSYCNKQKEMFGEDFSKIDFIDCDLNLNECKEAGIRGYPTWEIDGKLYSGLQSQERLAEITGC